MAKLELSKLIIALTIVHMKLYPEQELQDTNIDSSGRNY